MNKRKITIIFFLTFVLMCSGCNNYTLEDYATYDANPTFSEDQAEEKGTLLKERYDAYASGDIVLLEEYGEQGIMKTRPGYVNVIVTNVKVCKAEDNEEYSSYIDENALFKEWILKGAACPYDAEKGIFTSTYSDIGVTIFRIKMELNNPTDIEQDVSFCTLKLWERDDKTGSFTRLNIDADYIYEPVEKSQNRDNYTMAPGETLETTLWCIMPSERVLEYYGNVFNDKGQRILAKSEEYNKDSIYLHLNVKGSNNIIQENDNFIKIKFPEDY